MEDEICKANLQCYEEMGFNLYTMNDSGCQHTEAQATVRASNSSTQPGELVQSTLMSMLLLGLLLLPVHAGLSCLGYSHTFDFTVDIP